MVNEGQLPVGAEDHFRGTTSGLDLVSDFTGVQVYNRYIILTAHRHPHLLPVRRDEGLVRGTAYIGCLQDLVGCGVDHLGCVGCDINDVQEAPIWGEAEAMNVHLVPVHRPEDTIDTRLTKRDGSQNLTLVVVS